MPNYFKPDWLEDWKEERTKGKVRYFLLYGISFALACYLFDWIANKQDLSTKTPEQLLTMAAIFLGGGFTYSIASWFYNEHKLKKQQK
jgi:Na+/melibiose symporter-like transporter